MEIKLKTYLNLRLSFLLLYTWNFNICLFLFNHTHDSQKHESTTGSFWVVGVCCLMWTVLPTPKNYISGINALTFCNFTTAERSINFSVTFCYLLIINNNSYLNFLQQVFSFQAKNLGRLSRQVSFILLFLLIA